MMASSDIDIEQFFIEHLEQANTTQRMALVLEALEVSGLTQDAVQLPILLRELFYQADPQMAREARLFYYSKYADPGARHEFSLRRLASEDPENRAEAFKILQTLPPLEGEMREVSPAGEAPPTLGFQVVGILAREKLGRRSNGDVFIVDYAWGR